MSKYERLLKPAFDLTICIVLSIIAFTLYFVTLPQTVLWGDNANRIMLTYDTSLTLTTKIGIYPLPIITAKFFRQLMHLNPAYSHNLLSAIVASIVIAIFYLTVVIITNSRFSAIIATFAVMVSHTFWFVSIINESYPFYLLFFNILLLLIMLWIKTKKEKYLYIFSFVFGLSFLSGYSSLLMLPAIIFVLWKRKDVFKPRILLYIFLLGFLPWIYCLITDMTRLVPLRGGFVFWFIKLSLFAQFLTYINPKYLLPEILKYPFYLFYQFPLIGFLLGFFAILKVKKDEIITLIFILFLTEIIYGSGYFYQRHFHVYVFSYVTFAIFIALGAKIIEINKNLHFKITFASLMVILPILLYTITPYLIPKGYPILTIRDIPYRDNLKYFLQPSKRGYRGTYEYAKSALEQVKRGDVIIADFTILTVLEYFNKIEKMGEEGINLVFDERLTNHGIRIPEYVRDQVGKGVNVFLADNEDFYCIEELKKEYEIIPSGVLYKIVPKK